MLLAQWFQVDYINYMYNVVINHSLYIYKDIDIIRTCLHLHKEQQLWLSNIVQATKIPLLIIP